LFILNKLGNKPRIQQNSIKHFDFIVNDEDEDNSSWQTWLKHRHALPIRLDDTQPVRLNILTLGFPYELTGGPLNIMRFALQAAKAGINVRWINLDGLGLTHEQLAVHLSKYDGLESFGKLVSSHVWHATSLTSSRIPTNSNDIFMGTFYLTASVASATQKLLNKNPNIIYFIQDYESGFFPLGSEFVEATESYDLPHFAIFSTPMLRDYFNAKYIGVYKWNESVGDARSFSTLPSIKPLKFG